MLIVNHFCTLFQGSTAKERKEFQIAAGQKNLENVKKRKSRSQPSLFESPHSGDDSDFSPDDDPILILPSELNNKDKEIKILESRLQRKSEELTQHEKDELIQLRQENKKLQERIETYEKMIFEKVASIHEKIGGVKRQLSFDEEASVDKDWLFNFPVHADHIAAVSFNLITCIMGMAIIFCAK